MLPSIKKSRSHFGIILPATLWAVVFVIAALASGVWLHQHLKGFQVVAKMQDTPLLRAHYERALGAHLWQGGTQWRKLSDHEKWKIKTAVLDRLIEEELLAQYPFEYPISEEKLEASTAAAHRQLKKHFPAHSPYSKRLELQQISDSEFRKALNKEEAQLYHLEHLLNQEHPDSSSQAPTVTLPSRLKLSHIFLSKTGTKKKSRAPELARIRESIVKGELTFGAAAKLHSSDLRSNKTEGLLGWVSEVRLLPSLTKQLEHLPLNEISMPLESSIGWHLVKIHDRKAASVVEAPKSEAVAYLDDQHRKNLLEKWFQSRRTEAKIISNWEVIERCQPRL